MNTEEKKVSRLLRMGIVGLVYVCARARYVNYMTPIKRDLYVVLKCIHGIITAIALIIELLYVAIKNMITLIINAIYPLGVLRSMYLFRRFLIRKVITHDTFPSDGLGYNWNTKRVHTINPNSDYTSIREMNYFIPTKRDKRKYFARKSDDEYYGYPESDDPDCLERCEDSCTIRITQ